MADTVRTLAALQALLADNTSGDISAQDLRDFLVSAYHVVQVVTVQSGAVATGSTVLPIDDTIPQNTEGDEYLTLAITPTATTNTLRIEVVVSAGRTNAGALTVALFQDTTADALAAMQAWQAQGGGNNILTLVHSMTAGTTSATTFKVRIGPHTAGTVTFNGSGGIRQFGGVMASRITITEIIP